MSFSIPTKQYDLASLGLTAVSSVILLMIVIYAVLVYKGIYKSINEYYVFGAIVVVLIACISSSVLICAN